MKKRCLHKSHERFFEINIAKKFKLAYHFLLSNDYAINKHYKREKGVTFLHGFILHLLLKAKLKLLSLKK